jgi:hypothetical protein
MMRFAKMATVVAILGALAISTFTAAAAHRHNVSRGDVTRSSQAPFQRMTWEEVMQCITLAFV